MTMETPPIDMTTLVWAVIRQLDPRLLCSAGALHWLLRRWDFAWCHNRLAEIWVTAFSIAMSFCFHQPAHDAIAYGITYAAITVICYRVIGRKLEDLLPKGATHEI
jgi:hypothetical protein